MNIETAADQSLVLTNQRDNYEHCGKILEHLSVYEYFSFVANPKKSSFRQLVLKMGLLMTWIRTCCLIRMKRMMSLYVCCDLFCIQMELTQLTGHRGQVDQILHWSSPAQVPCADTASTTCDSLLFRIWHPSTRQTTL